MPDLECKLGPFHEGPHLRNDLSAEAEEIGVARVEVHDSNQNARKGHGSIVRSRGQSRRAVETNQNPNGGLAVAVWVGFGCDWWS